MLITALFYFADAQSANDALSKMLNLRVKPEILRQVHSCNPNHKPEVLEVHFEHDGPLTPHPTVFPRWSTVETLASKTNTLAVTVSNYQIWPSIKAKVA